MSLTVVLLDSEENFIKYLNAERTQLKETDTQYGLRTISMEYFVKDVSDYNLFKIGNKIWVSNDNSEDCLYVINTHVENDLFESNKVEFESEEKLTELNHVFFSQTDITNASGIININYNSLHSIFKDYFKIGIVQNCLSPYMQNVQIKGTMTLMELLRLIEEETGNVFRARYEKEINSNKINCYLDFLNPKSTTKNWELHLFYEFPDEESAENTPEKSEIEDLQDVSDIVYFPEYNPETPLNPEELELRMKYDEVILLSEDVITLGFTGDDDVYDFKFSYNGNTLIITINGVSNEFTDLNIPNNTVIELYNTVSNKIEYQHKITPKLGDTHEKVLNLGYNVENIDYDIDESDTFTAIAPIISHDDLTYAQLNKLIQSWIDLSITKGELVPMIIQKRTITGTEEQPCTSEDYANHILGTFNVSNNYYSRPINPSDSKDSTNKSFEFNVATAYWKAPFSKIEGELYVSDDTITGVEYSHIQGNQDNIDEHNVVITPRAGSVETSDDDPYAIFNDVCMKLKDKRYPEININVDVADLSDDGKFNDFQIFDKVYVKIPTMDELILASVNQVERNLLDLAETTVELTNFSVNKKVAQKKTEIESTNISFSYPASKTLTAKLINLEYDGQDSEFIKDRLLSFAVYVVENNTETFTGNVYNKTTDNNGNATINLNLKPGNYIVEITFPGDVEYESANTSVKINVGGSIETNVNKTKINTMKKVKRYYSKLGVSPNKELLVSIGKKNSGKTYFVTIFKRKCPNCGSKQLYWSMFFAGDELRSNGIFPQLYKTVSGSNKGRIYCKKCEHGWDALGESLNGGKDLTVHKKTSKSTKAKVYELKNGKRVFDSVLKQVKIEKVLGNTGVVLSRNNANTGEKYSDIVKNSIIKTAKNIVGNSKGIPAAKKLAKWVGKNIKHEKREGLYQRPITTLNRKKGNCISQTDLYFQMCDAVGVTSKYDLYYIHIGGDKYGTRHFFGRVNGVDVDVDVKRKNPWGHASYKKKIINKRTKYPELPISKKYKE